MARKLEEERAESVERLRLLHEAHYDPEELRCGQGHKVWYVKAGLRSCEYRCEFGHGLSVMSHMKGERGV